jgi:ribosomal protein S27AE
MPYFDGDRVRYRDASITCDPGYILPISGIKPDEREFELSWPPPGVSLPSPVSPEFESNTFYGQLKRAHIATKYGVIDCIVSENEPTMRAMPIWMKWPEPFNDMFPTGGGIDLLHHHGLMRKCVEQLTNGQSDRALRTIETWMNRLSGEAETRLERAWFLPKLMSDPETVLCDAEGKFGFACTTIDELISSQQFRERMRSHTKVRRVQGWLGYFWWELYQDANARVAIRLCKACGQVIRKGHSDRQYCTRAENPQCFRERNGAAQRQVRAKRNA